ncbi:MAG: DUF4007 domain-containing protein [Betaproteobacteria bacterium HGW-Betaproteobacteria-1]|jgi:hypothetical protein|nr:MAG: DUF4007 domain-containing protein [Betaproteobacteria bacterium HGW-Betaproteobacteria-1]
MENYIFNKAYQPHFSGHETFPLRQMWLKKAFDCTSDGLSIDKSVFSQDQAIAVFGVGKNMVSSIRHWALACGIIQENIENSNAYLISSDWADILSSTGLDPYCERASTTWLAHWRLAGAPIGKHRATTCWWLFNNVTALTFNKDDIYHQLSKYAADKETKISESTLSRDIETCLRAYCPRSEDSVEDVAEPMLGELGLILDQGNGSFAFSRGPKASLSDGLFIYTLLEYWDRNFPGESSLAFESIAYGPGSPGLVFKLDEDSIAERLLHFSDSTDGLLVWSDLAGIRQMTRRILDQDSTNNLKNKLLLSAYD